MQPTKSRGDSEETPTFQFSWSLIATSGPLVFRSRPGSLSILLESYCNSKTPSAAVPRKIFQFSWSLIATSLGSPFGSPRDPTFNSPGVLLQHRGVQELRSRNRSFQFSWSLIATLNVVEEALKSSFLSILLESYCNLQHPFILTYHFLLINLSILLESYCNTSREVGMHRRPSSFNSPGVLLQPRAPVLIIIYMHAFNSPGVLLQRAV